MIALSSGYTTLICIAITILLVIIYLYYESAIQRLKTVCFKRLPSGTAVDDTVNNLSKIAFQEAGENGVPMHASHQRHQDVAKKKLLEEPGILCDCGQVHILRTCLKENDLRPYQHEMDKLTSRLQSEATTKCVMAVDVSQRKITQGDLNAVEEEKEITEDAIEKEQDESVRSNDPSTLSTVPGDLEEPIPLPGSPTSIGSGVITNDSATDSDVSSSRCGTPLIQVHPVEKQRTSTTGYSGSSSETERVKSGAIWHSGARPKEYNLKDAVS